MGMRPAVSPAVEENGIKSLKAEETIPCCDRKAAM
jgi:hypothetical protein